MTATALSPQIPFATLSAAAGGIASAPASELPDDVIQMGIDVCRFTREWNRKAEKAFRDWMSVGALGDVVRGATGQYLSDTEAYINHFQDIRKQLGPSALYHRVPTPREMFIAEFSFMLDDLLAFRGLVKSMYDLACRPPTEPDLERIRLSEEAYARGETRAVGPGFLPDRPW